MIYTTEFQKYLTDSFGDDNVSDNHKNIIIPCPWCDINKPDRSKNHLWISKEIPIFHCFRGGCNHSGILKKLFKKIDGKDTSNSYIDESKIKEVFTKKTEFKKNVFKPKNIHLPDLNIESYKLKELYVKQRLKFANIPLTNLKGLIFDINTFLRVNNIELPDNVDRMKDYLHSNFVGFMSEHNSCIVLRNIDQKSNFRYYKLHIQESQFLDYYQLYGGDNNSNDIVMAEGIFDIMSEHIFDFTKLKDKVRLYIAALSTSFQSAIKSVVFHHQIFRPTIHILSDNGVELDYYRSLKRYNKHLINKIIVYYNKNGKDFNDTPINLTHTVI